MRAWRRQRFKLLHGRTASRPLLVTARAAWLTPCGQSTPQRLYYLVVPPLQDTEIAPCKALGVAEHILVEARAQGGGAGPLLVLLDNLAEGDDLGVGEADEGLDLVADAEELAFVLGDAALAAEELGRRWFGG
jgi:hypothetical protein